MSAGEIKSAVWKWLKLSSPMFAPLYLADVPLADAELGGDFSVAKYSSNPMARAAKGANLKRSDFVDDGKVGAALEVFERVLGIFSCRGPFQIARQVVLNVAVQVIHLWLALGVRDERECNGTVNVKRPAGSVFIAWIEAQVVSSHGTLRDNFLAPGSLGKRPADCQLLRVLKSSNTATVAYLVSLLKAWNLAPLFGFHAAYFGRINHCSQ